MNARRWLLALTALLLAAATTPAVSAARPYLTVHLAQQTISFSPDGDGRQDRARIRFSLTRAADVTVRVERAGDVVRGPVKLGRLRAGVHAWTWDGTRNGGPRVHDGTFEILIHAEGGGQHTLVGVTTYVDRIADAGRLLTSRPAVYPKAGVVSDRVALVYLREGWNAEEAATPFDGTYEPRPVLDLQLTVVDGSGRTVWQRGWTPQYGWQDGSGLTFTFSWYARGPGGEPVPEGTYTARVRVRDPAGNESTYSAPITVSHQQLKAALWTTTVPAASATRYTPAGCGPSCTQGCFPVASDRFPDGLSFRACPDNGSTRAWFSAAPPVLGAPVDTYRITATGGPTTPGTDDVGSLSGYRTIGPGDATASMPWLHAGLVAPPYLPDQHASVSWGFSTSVGDSYDIASFTVDYRYYVPVG